MNARALFVEALGVRLFKERSVLGGNFLTNLRNATAVAVGVLATGIVMMFGLSDVAPSAAMPNNNDVEKSGVAQSPANSTTETLEGTLIDWTLEFSSEATDVQYDLRIVDTMTSNLDVVPASVETPPGWVVDGTDPLTFSAAVVPPEGLGYAVSTQPKETSISGGAGGGDGYVPLFGADGNIYFTYHHWDPGVIQCIDPNTGSVCAGYPINMTVDIGGTPRNMATPASANGATIIGNRLYQAGVIFAENSYGIGCWDLSTRLECNDRPYIEFPHPAGYGAASGNRNHNFAQGPYLIDDNFYVWDSHQRVHCVDSTTWATCAGYPVSMLDPATLPRLTANPQFTGATLGTQLFMGFSMNMSTEEGATLTEATFACFDTATNAECAGWNGGASNTQVENWVYGIWFRYNAAGVADAVCEQSYSWRRGGCLSLTDGSLMTDIGTRGIPPALYTRNTEGSIIDAVKHPVLNRSYFSNYGNGMQVCWDWTTSDWCLANSVGSPGDLNAVDTTGDGYVGDAGRIRSGGNTRDYGARYDPTTGCWWSLGDANILWSFDDAGNVPCVPRTVAADGQDGFAGAYCRSGVPADLTWDTAVVENLDPADWASFTVTLSLPDGTLIGTIDALSGTSSFDLSALDPSTVDTIAYDISGAMAAGRNPLDDPATTPIVTIKWNSNTGVEFCYQTQTVGDPCTANVASNSASINTAGGPAEDTATQTFDVVADPVGKCFTPNMTLDKTVYAGHDGGASCSSGVESLPVEENDDVTWCLTVTNTGDADLASISITDPDLPGSPFSVPGQLAVGESTTIHVEGSSGTADFTNTASATGTPVFSDGSMIPGASTPSDDDTAAVDIRMPDVDLAKTIYVGHDGAANCGTAGELATVDAGDPVTWCFTVTNSGDTHLNDISIADPDLPGSPFAAPGVLAPGASTTIHVETSAGADLTNNATVSTTPSDSIGTTIPHLTAPSDSDTAQVEVVAPGIEVDKTIVAGPSGDCANGVETIEAVAGATLTWCFAVMNIGDTDLADVVVNDPALGVTGLAVGDLDVGQSATVSVDSTATADLNNTADVTGTPVDDTGDPLSDVSAPTDDDRATVDVKSGTIDLAKTVSATGSCPGVEILEAINGAPVTWCFEISNPGTTPITDLSIDDAMLGITLTSPVTLLPGESVTLTHAGTVAGNQVNSATAEGTPSDADGDVLPGGTPITSDPDVAEIVELSVEVTLAKTVVAGTVDASSCPGTELLSVDPGDDVTWCLSVTNSGQEDLADIAISDPNLPGSPFTVPGVLAPGESTTVVVSGTVAGDLTNIASVTATGLDDKGNPLPGPEVVDEDTASIDEVNPGVTITKTLYLGSDDGASCPGAPSLTVGNGATVTWCFTVENTGDTALIDVAVTDTQLAWTDTVNGPIQPGESVVLHHESTVDGPLENVVDVAARASASDGTPFLAVEPVTDDDSATLLTLEPSITIEKSITLGHDNAGDCPGADEVTIRNGLPRAVTWCFVVTNTGTTTLSDVEISDPLLPNSPYGVGSMVAGQSIVLSDEDLVLGDVVNTASVVGIPSGSDGAPLAGFAPVGDDDSAQIDAVEPITVSGTVFLDADLDGVRDDDESGLPGASVTIVGTDINGDPIEITVPVAADGSWQIPAGLLPPNEDGYTVTVVGPDEELLPTTATAQTIFPNPGDAAIVDAVGFAEPGYVKGNVYGDDDRDGERADGESGLTGVTVVLSGTDVSGTTIHVELVTDEDGNFDFGAVPPSDGSGYIITIDETTVPADRTIVSGSRAVAIVAGHTVDESFPAQTAATSAQSTPTLAFTGRTTVTIVRIAFGLIALGVLFLALSAPRANEELA